MRYHYEKPTIYLSMYGKRYICDHPVYDNVVDASLLRGGHPAGQIGQVYGIVEFKDGVRRVDPVSIKFCDEENANLCALVKHNEALRKGEVNAED